MEDEKKLINTEGSMRLGAYDCLIDNKNSKLYKAYEKSLIQERHRHRYEFNNAYKTEFERNGMICTGINPETGLVEAVELSAKKWFVGVQYHPEYNSTVVNPNPLFMSFIEAAIN